VAATCGVLAIVVGAAIRSPEANAEQQPLLTGVNIAGAEFGSAIPGRAGTDYFYPTAATIDYFSDKGMNVLRIPFRWERLQPSLHGELDKNELRRLDGVVANATGKRMTVVLDVHNYAAYRKQPIGTGAVSLDALADLWGRLADRYKNNDKVVFGLMNEPKGLPTERWLAAANSAIAEIRRHGAGNLILVPGNGWTGAHSWLRGNYGTANGAVMDKIVDPVGRYAYELHQYLDKNYSGTSPRCVGEAVGTDALKRVTDWLRERRQRGFLAEFGGSADPLCLAALDAMLAYMKRNKDVWLGWTYWAAGPWSADYFTSVQPLDGIDRPQMDVLLKYVSGAAAKPSERRENRR
jgi:endoglucanase